MKGSLFASALCILGAAASPLNKRVLVTDVAVTVVTITVTETPGAATSVPASTTSVAATTVPAAGAANVNNEYPRPAWTSTETETTVVVPSSTSTTVAPEPTTTVAPEPTTTAAPTTAAAVEASSTSTSVSVATDSSYQTLILNSHNIHRSNHSAPALAWNETLAQSALALANTCDYHHDTSLGPAANYGQNIAYGIDSDKVDQIITNMMYNDEMGYYQGLYGEANPDMTNFEHWGHFSQIVWVDTATVGCATVTCSNLAESGSSLALPFTVCNYYPAGNYGGEYGANVLEPLGNPTVIAS